MDWGIVAGAAVALAGALTAWLKADAALRRVKAHRHPVSVVQGQSYAETGKAIPVLPGEQEVTPSGTA